jgi:hypothetical protein
VSDEREEPNSFILDASVLDDVDVHEVVRDDIKQNRIQFFFPKGLNRLDLLEECRAISNSKDFDLMYDITMQMLEGKPLVILSVCDDGSRRELCSFQVTDKYMDLRGIDVIDASPCLVNWLTEFIGAYLVKKYPIPSQSALSPKESKKAKDSKGTTAEPPAK